MAENAQPPTALEPGEITYDTFTLWGIRNDATGNVILADVKRENAERRLRGVVAREEGEPHHVLIRQRVVRRVEEWREPLEVIPWHTPCNWVGTAADESGAVVPDSTYCLSHDHGEGEPVPAESIRGASS